MVTKTHFLNLLPPALLDDDALDYISSAFTDADSNELDIQDVKDISQDFLLDAGMSEEDISQFFSQLTLSNCNPSTNGKNETRPDGPVKLSHPVIFSETDPSLPVEAPDAVIPDEPKPVEKNKKSRSTKERTFEVVATSQVSRFHTDTLETLSNDVDLKGVNITVGDTTLLVDAELRLFKGVKYGLIGANGVGKSTLLKSIGYKQLIGFPSNVQVLYVEQLEGVDTSKSVVQVVVDADKKVTRYRREYSLLQSAVESTAPTRVAEALRRIRYERLMEEKDTAHAIAIRRSGARGAEARKQLVKLEEMVQALEEKHSHPIEEEELNRAAIEAQKILADLCDVLEMHDHDSAESKARKILTGIGFPVEWQDGPLGQLSGGWRIRVALASALQIAPDILLLDEPTNHLDLPAILWLQDYLASLKDITVVCVSHDRAFLNTTVEEIIVFKNKTLKYYTGNLDEYLEAREDKRKHDQKMSDAIDRKKAAAEKSVREGMVRARQSGDDKKLAVMASKQRKLERIGVEVNEKGHRFKLNRDRVGYFLGTRSDAEVEKEDTMSDWTIPVPTPLRHPGPLLEVEGVSFEYDSQPRVLANVTLNVGQNARIGIVGANGSGKTTLVKLLMGELEPTKGTIRRHSSAKIGYFTQHHVDDLHHRPKETCALALFKEKVPEAREQDARAHLGAHGIKEVATSPLASLSGGQMVRVAFALSTFGTAPHLLVLDEPTNHLDFLTTEAMLAALKRFEGGVIVVSHDQYFVSQLANEVYLVQQGAVKKLQGGVDDYVDAVRKNLSKRKPTA